MSPVSVGCLNLSVFGLWFHFCKELSDFILNKTEQNVPIVKEDTVRLFLSHLQSVSILSLFWTH